MQRSDLIASRRRLEAQGEAFGCFQCGTPLPPLGDGHSSDLCERCDELEAHRAPAAIEAASVLCGSGTEETARAWNAAHSELAR